MNEFDTPYPYATRSENTPVLGPQCSVSAPFSLFEDGWPPPSSLGPPLRHRDFADFLTLLSISTSFLYDSPLIYLHDLFPKIEWCNSLLSDM